MCLLQLISITFRRQINSHTHSKKHLWQERNGLLICQLSILASSKTVSKWHEDVESGHNYYKVQKTTSSAFASGFLFKHYYKYWHCYSVLLPFCFWTVNYTGLQRIMYESSSYHSDINLGVPQYVCSWCTPYVGLKLFWPTCCDLVKILLRSLLLELRLSIVHLNK